MKVKKFTGELVEFDINRLKGSLYKSGASTEVVERVWESMNQYIFDEITTRDLYKLAFKLLKKESNSFAARYSLKKALRDLGPAGYHFEKWVAKLFEHANYETITGKIVQGRAVTHEADVIARKGSEMLIAECKFRNTVDARISVTTPMYFLSRFKDLENLKFNLFEEETSFTEGWLVTNAYLTKDAISFGEYYDVNLLSWDYPENHSIKNRVDNAGLYPITCLTTILSTEKELLLEKGCILVKDILRDKNILDLLGCSSKKRANIIKEAKELVNNYNIEKNEDN